MTSKLMRHGTGVLWAIAVMAILSAHASAIGSPVCAESKELKGFVAHVRELLRAKDAAGLIAMAAKPENLNWIEQRSFRGQPDWKLASVSTANGSDLAVFSDFHTCESIGDHVHSIVKTADGLRFGPEIMESDTSGFRVRDHDLHVKFE